MATSRIFSRFLPFVVVGVITVLISGLARGVPAHAEPPPAATPDSVSETIRNLGEEVEKIAEEHKAAEIQRDKESTKAAEANARAEALDGEIEKLRAKVGALADGALKRTPAGPLTQFFASDEPSAFLDQLTAIDMIGRQQNKAVSSLAEAKSAAEVERSTAEKAAVEAEKLVTDLANKKADIEGKIDQQQNLLNELNAEQRTAVFGAGLDLPANIDAEGVAASAIEAARSKLGAPYVWGAEGPSSFDCSGLTLWAFAQAGVFLPRTSASQATVGMAVSRSALRPGDLVFYYSPVHHVGIYIGGNAVLHAPTTGDVVKISALDAIGPFTGARRVA